MESKIFWTIYSTANILLLLCFIHSIYTIKRKSFNPLLFAYLLVTIIYICINTTGNLGVIFFERFTLLQINLVYTISHYIILSILIKNEIKTKLIANLIPMVATLLFLVVMFLNSRENSLFYVATISSIFLIFMSLLYYYEFQYNGDITDTGVGFFYFVTGVFLSSGLITPIFFISKYLRVLITKETYTLISCIAPFSSIVFYSFILKYYKCREADI